jgi:hypothetical protein
MLGRVNVVQLLLPDFSLILCGYLLCRYTALNRSVWQPLESLVYYFLFPVLLFHSIVRNPLDVSAAASLAAAGVCLAVAGIALAYSLPWWPWLGRHIDRRQHAAAAQVGFRFNSFVALALAGKVAGPEGTQLVAVLIGLCVPLFNMGAVWPMHRHPSRGDGTGSGPAGRGFAHELLRNPLILATLGGLAANLAGLHIPDWLEPTVTRIGAASLALGLMAAGAGMQLGQLSRVKALGAGVLLIKHLLFPLLAWALARAFALPPAQAAVLLMFSALPTASSCYVLAARMGYDGSVVAGLVTLSTLAAVGSLPLALALLQRV